MYTYGQWWDQQHEKGLFLFASAKYHLHLFPAKMFKGITYRQQSDIFNSTNLIKYLYENQ